MLLNVEGARTIDGSSLIRIDRNATPRHHAAPLLEQASAGYIFANKTYMSTWSDYTRNGIYALSTDGETCQPVLLGDAINGSRGMCYFDGQLWISYVYQAALLAPKYIYHYVIDFATGNLIRDIDPGYMGSTSTSMVYDRYTGRLYGSFTSDDNMGYVFGTVDPVTGVRTALGNLPFALTGMAIDSDHHMWAINQHTGILYEVNMTSGALTQRGNTGLKSTYTNSGCIDPLTDTYYYTVCNLNQSALYTIDLATAQATLVKEFPLNDEYLYMWMPTAVNNAVPGKPSNLTTTFEGDALQGSVSFSVPSLLANGTQGQGQATATIYVNGVAVLQKQVNYGSSITENITVPQNGSTIIAVALTNDNGESAVARTEPIAIGGENLPAPTGVYTRTFTDSGAVRIYWDAYPGENVTYDVTRYPEVTVVATGLTSAYYREVPPAGSHYYGVRAHVDGRLTAEAFTETIGSATAPVPYDNCFENRDRVNELTYINANNDDYVWLFATSLDYRGTHGIYMPYNARELTFWEQMQGIEPETDDWAVTPGLQLEKGKIYTITYNMSTKGYDEVYEVKMGTAPTVGAMTTTIIPRSIVPASVLPVGRQDYSKTFTVNADGTYYIGLHCMSAGGFWLCVYEIHVSEGIEPDAPAQPAINVTADENGALKGNVQVTAPSVTQQNTTLTAIDHIDLKLEGEVVHTWQNPAPGAALTAEVAVPRLGEYEFEAVAYKSATSHGPGAKVSTFIGAKAPSDVASVAIAETENSGEVVLTWPPVTTATDQTAIDPSLVTYIIYDTESQIVTEVTGDTTVTIQAAAPNSEQQLVRYYVGSKYGDRYCHATAFTPQIIVGRPYELPFYETSTTAAFRYLWAYTGPATWQLLRDQPNVTSADGDGSFMIMQGEYVDDQSALTSGKIKLSGSNILLDLSYMKLQNDSNTLAVNVVCDGVATNLANYILADPTAATAKWHSAQFSLDAFSGKTIQLQLVGTIKTHVSILVDGIKISSTPVDTTIGDVDGDGKVDVSDVNAAINIILKTKEAGDYPGNADVDGDGKVDVSDVNAIINIILKQ